MIVSTLDPATWISVRTENLIESSPRVKIVKNSSGFIQLQPSERVSRERELQSAQSSPLQFFILYIVCVCSD